MDIATLIGWPALVGSIVMILRRLLQKASLKSTTLVFGSVGLLAVSGVPATQIAILCGVAGLCSLGVYLYSSRAWVFTIALAATAVLWCVTKTMADLGGNWKGVAAGRDALVEGLGAPTVLGLSYAILKLYHLWVDCRKQRIKEVRAMDVLAWLLFFPTVVAGPIQKFQDWQKHSAAPIDLLDGLSLGAPRIVLGLFKKVVVATWIYPLTIAGLTPSELGLIGVERFALAVVAYSFYLYFDFSAYSDIAIGLGHLFGVRLPENFDWPYARRNIQEFWNAWHMSLSSWLREYVFTPFGMAMSRRPQLRRHRSLLVVVPPIVTFVIGGLWHGFTVGFLLWGLMHGVGLASFVLFKRYASGSKLIVLRWWSTSRLGYLLSALLTFCYVSVTWIPFALSDAKLMVLLERISG